MGLVYVQLSRQYVGGEVYQGIECMWVLKDRQTIEEEDSFLGEVCPSANGLG
jgi:hypothetical protein